MRSKEFRDWLLFAPPLLPPPHMETRFRTTIEGSRLSYTRMKRMRLTLRKLMLVLVLLTVAVLVLSLPLTTHYSHLLQVGTNPPPAVGQVLLSVKQSDEREDQPHRTDPLVQKFTSIKKNTVEATLGNESNTKDGIAGESIDGKSIAKNPVAEKAAISEETLAKEINSPKGIRVATAQSKNGSAEENIKITLDEYETYLQNQTPANFVEVKKINPISKKSTRLSVIRKRPPNTYRPRSLMTRSPSKLTPDVLKKRALTFSNSSAAPLMKIISRKVESNQ
ncbi:hypothetical protein Hamer_G002056 [Homarus americanus]|uniref:Uncharacterized protein n=1 Tax=Homarus americanus TaxID=6706 RepID=A0A8J5JVJ1_HOMAM|nr:hypothetical protein Hamer_G002056 [Homarus americanus]